MKILIGFFLGLAMASAIAQTTPGSPLWTPVNTYMNAAVDPDGKQAPIHVDANGYVICSDQKKP